jgi:GNAT superfamily N-acetyltransferase
MIVQTATTRDHRSIVNEAEAYLADTYYKTFTEVDRNHVIEHLRRYMINPNCHTVVARNFNDDLVGFAIAHTADYDWFPGTRVQVAYIWLRPEHRGSGVAEEMLARIETWARSIGARDMIVSGIGDTARALEGWYNQQGFNSFGFIAGKALA